jgi:hypothetical protein
MGLARSDGTQQETITSVAFGEINGRYYLASGCAVGTVEVYEIKPNITKSSSLTLLRAHRRVKLSILNLLTMQGSFSDQCSPNTSPYTCNVIQN